MKAEEILKKYCGAEEKVILPDNEKLQYCGRIDYESAEGPLWVYPATNVTMKFSGKSLKAVVSNQHAYWENSLGWILDGKEYKGNLNETGITCLTLAENLPEGEHELCLFKRMDSCHMVYFHGLIGDNETVLHLPSPLPNRRIEVYGDSVSAGEVSEAVEYCGKADPEHNGEFSNSYYSYAWITARKLNASLHDIAQGGIALLDKTGWFMEGNYIGMEQTFDKLQYQPTLCIPKPWDFKKYTPHVVMIALGQNDNNPEDYMAQDYHGDRAVYWRKRYGEFITTLRGIYPKAHIICKTTILGHHKNWDNSIDEVCRELKDDKVHHFLYSNNGVGTEGHIRIPEAAKMAEELSAFIESLGADIWND